MSSRHESVSSYIDYFKPRFWVDIDDHLYVSEYLTVKLLLPPADVIILQILCIVYFHQEYLSACGLAQMYFIIHMSLIVLLSFSQTSTRQGIGISYFYRLFVYTLRKKTKYHLIHYVCWKHIIIL